MKGQNNYNAQINKHIGTQHCRTTFSLCKLYDRQLKEKQDHLFINQEQREREKIRKHNFTMSKLL